MKYSFLSIPIFCAWLITPVFGQKTNDPFEYMGLALNGKGGLAMDRGGDSSLLLAERSYYWNPNENKLSSGDSIKYYYDINCNVTEAIHSIYSLAI